MPTNSVITVGLDKLVPLTGVTAVLVQAHVREGGHLPLARDFPALWEFQDNALVMLKGPALATAGSGSKAKGGRFWTATIIPDDVAWQPDPCDETQAVTQTVDHFYMHFSLKEHLGSLMTLADGRLLWVVERLFGGDKGKPWCWVERR